MQQTVGALAALAILTLLIVGPVFVVVSNAADGGHPTRCADTIGCNAPSTEPFPS